MEGASLFDQRKHRRTTFSTEVWLGQDGIFTRTRVVLRDLSEAGAFLETSQKFPVGSILNVQFMLPEISYPISSTVAVRHLGGDAGLGVEFLDISPEARHIVSGFLAREAAAPQSQ